MGQYRCPVCGYPGLTVADPNGPLALFLGGYDICPCCDTEFGLDIDVGSPEEVAEQIRRRRQEWIASGHPWVHKQEPPSPNWDWKENLRAIGVEVA
jgi:hypothetical protein